VFLIFAFSVFGNVFVVRKIEIKFTVIRLLLLVIVKWYKFIFAVLFIKRTLISVIFLKIPVG